MHTGRIEFGKFNNCSRLQFATIVDFELFINFDLELASAVFDDRVHRHSALDFDKDSHLESAHSSEKNGIDKAPGKSQAPRFFLWSDVDVSSMVK